MKNLTIYIVVGILLSHLSFSQSNIIEIVNPSYESYPKHSTVAKSWVSLNMKDKSAPDIQPGFFDVKKEPRDGQSYLGMVTRHDGTFEIISPQLSQPIQAHQTYEWIFHLSRSDTYNSHTLRSGNQSYENFTSPVHLSVYGTNDIKKNIKIEPLAVIQNLKNIHDWRRYKVTFTPKETYKHIIVSVEHTSETKDNGHILIDHFYPIVAIDSTSGKPLDKIPFKEELLFDINKLETTAAQMKALAQKIPFDFLYKESHLPYQLQKMNSKEYRYNNVYWDALTRLASKKNKKIIILRKNSPRNKLLRSYIRHYLIQRKIPSPVVIKNRSKRNLRKYKNSVLLYESKNISVFAQL